MKAIYKKAGLLLAVLLFVVLLKHVPPPERRPYNGSISVTMGELAYMSVDDLFRESTLVALGTLSGEPHSFYIQPVGAGRNGIYTDCTFTLQSVLVGEEENPTITVRLRGGTVGNDTHIVEDTPVFKPDQQYLLFLYQPGIGGSYYTEGDYYYVVGMKQGVFVKRADGSYISGTWVVLRENELVAPADLEPADPRKRYLETLESIYEHGIITKEGYEDELAQLDQYATIVDESEE